MLERLNKLANELTVLSGDTIVPALEFIESYDVDQKVVTRAYRPDVMEKELKIMALLDRQCEKVLCDAVRLSEGFDMSLLTFRNALLA